MKFPRNLSAGTALFMLFAGVSRTQPAPTAASASAASAAPAVEDPAHNELRALRAGLMAAVKSDDIEKTLTYLHPDIAVTWHNAEISRGRDGVKAYHDKMLVGPNRIVRELTADIEVDRLSSLFGGDTAIAEGTSVEHFKLMDGLEFTLTGRWSATLVRENGSWLIVCVHTSNNLFDNPLLDGARRMSYWLALAGLGCGLLAGILITRFLSRR